MTHYGRLNMPDSKQSKWKCEFFIVILFCMNIPHSKTAFVTGTPIMRAPTPGEGKVPVTLSKVQNIQPTTTKSETWQKFRWRHEVKKCVWWLIGVQTVCVLIYVCIFSFERSAYMTDGIGSSSLFAVFDIKAWVSGHIGAELIELSKV